MNRECRERRNFARLDIHAKTHLRRDNQYVEGVLDNLSIKGAFVTAASQIGINDVVAVSIDDTFACDLIAKVVRVTDKGIGLQFEKTLRVENGPWLSIGL